MSTSVPLYPARQTPLTGIYAALLIGLAVCSIRTDSLQDRMQYLHWGVWHQMTSKCHNVNDFRLATVFLAHKRPIGLTRPQCLQEFGNPQSVSINPSQFKTVAFATEAWTYHIGDDGEISLRFKGDKCVGLTTSSLPCKNCAPFDASVLPCIRIIRKDLCRQYHCKNEQLFETR